MFKLRPSVPASDATPASIEAIRVRARQRLIGAAVLVGLGVMGFPLVFDTEPRPLSADVPIEIPSRPMSAPAAPAAPVELGQPTQIAAAPAQAPVVVAPSESLDSSEVVLAAQAPQATAFTEPPAAVAVEANAKPQSPSTSTGADASSQADNRPTTNTRIVVQVGAFANATKARDVRRKLERAGLKTYTTIAKTPDGERIRVRIGPFTTKAEADKAAAQAKAMGLEAGLYWL